MRSCALIARDQSLQYVRGAVRVASDHEHFQSSCLGPKLGFTRTCDKVNWPLAADPSAFQASRPYSSHHVVVETGPPRTAAAAFVPEHSPRSNLLRALSRTGNSISVFRAAGLLRSNPPRVLHKIRYVNSGKILVQPPAAYRLFAQHQHQLQPQVRGETSVLQPHEIQAAWEQLGRAGRSPFKQSTSDAKAQLGAMAINTFNVASDTHQQTGSHVTMTPELAIMVASHSLTPPTGFWEFHDELTLKWQKAKIKTDFSVFSQAVSAQWNELSPEERTPYLTKSYTAVQSWQAERSDLDARLRACGHKAILLSGPHRAVRTSNALRLYLSKLPHDLADAFILHARRSPSGFSVFMQDSASKMIATHFVRHRKSRVMCRTSASKWRSMSAGEREPYIEKALKAQTSWSDERTLLRTKLKMAGCAPLIWDKDKQQTSLIRKRNVKWLPPSLSAAIATYPKPPLNHYNMFLRDFACASKRSQHAPKLLRGEFWDAAASHWCLMPAEQKQAYVYKASEARRAWKQNRLVIDSKLRAGGHAPFSTQVLDQRPSHSYDVILQILSSRCQRCPTESVRLLIEQVQQGIRVLAPNQHNAFRKVGVFLKYIKLILYSTHS